MKQAEAFRKAGGIDCRFVDTNIYDIDQCFDDAFDIVLITIGVFGWMPDLPGFMRIATYLLRNDGALLVYEQHLIMNMMEPFKPDPDPARLTHSDFRREPFEEEGPLVYDGREAASNERHYWIVHSLADILSSYLDHGLKIERYKEYPHNISGADVNIFDDQAAQLPQCLMLTARKTA